MKRGDVGTFRHHCDLESATFAADSAGQMIPTWSANVAEVPCSVHTVQGGENFRGRQVDATATHVVITRWIGITTTEMRINWIPDGVTSRYLNIVAIKDRDGRQRFMELDCREGV